MCTSIGYIAQLPWPMGPMAAFLAATQHSAATKEYDDETQCSQSSTSRRLPRDRAWAKIRPGEGHHRPYCPDSPLPAREAPWSYRRICPYIICRMCSERMLGPSRSRVVITGHRLDGPSSQRANVGRAVASEGVSFQAERLSARAAALRAAVRTGLFARAN